MIDEATHECIADSSIRQLTWHQPSGCTQATAAGQTEQAPWGEFRGCAQEPC